MTVKKFLKVILYVLLLILFYIFGQKLKDFYNSKVLPARGVHMDEDCSVTMFTRDTRNQVVFARYVIDAYCGDTLEPVISNDGIYVMFEARLLLEGNKNVNAIFVYSYPQSMVFKAFDYGQDKVEKLAFDKDDNLLISLITKDGNKIEKKILNDDYEADFNAEDGQALSAVKALPEVKAWLGNNDNREVFIEDVDDDIVLIRVYEYFEKDNSTKTFGWYEYSRLTGEITKLSRKI